MTLDKVSISKKSIEDYSEIVGKGVIKELRELAEPLRGKRVVHINATPKGGGVAEILDSLIPLLQDLGVKAEWHVINPPVEFFEVSKKFHNALQGNTAPISKEEMDFYLEVNEGCGEAFGYLEGDLFVVHDAQPMAGWHFANKKVPGISRIHVDSSKPSPQIMDFLKPYMLEYNKVVFSLESFVPEDFPNEKVAILAPAIDPLAFKNLDMGKAEAREELEKFGIDKAQPLVAQVSRFDPWKDPIGVVEAYRMAKKKFPGLQLIMMGVVFAKDDPEQGRVFREVLDYVGGDSDVHLFFNPKGLLDVSNEEMVRMIQAGADVIMQKSTREGFGLTATEALWKGAPVIAGKAGGLALQVEDGKTGILIESTKDAGEALIKLLGETRLRKSLGENGRERVREHFLITRLLKDHIKLYRELISSVGS